VAGQSYSFVPTGSDPNHDTLVFSVTNKPAWATFSSSTGQLSGTPAKSSVGTYSNIVISVSDGKASASLAAFTIVVSAPPNNPPTISGQPPKSVNAGSPYSFQPSASDPDGDALTFSIQNKPTWATFSSTTGALSGTPGAADVGTASNIIISVSDGKASVSLPAFSISVNQISMGSASLTWTAPTTNTDGSTLTTFAGYRIVYGTSPSALSQTTQIANPTVTTYTVSNLSSGTWYFAVKAYLADGTESIPTNPVSIAVP
jgi:hypothetical protein